MVIRIKKGSALADTCILPVRIFDIRACTLSSYYSYLDNRRK